MAPTLAGEPLWLPPRPDNEDEDLGSADEDLSDATEYWAGADYEADEENNVD